jgi:ribosomal protein L3 glutamine methyltransferase
MKTLAPEFRKEPRLALDGGKDGLDVIRKLVAQARDRLTRDGLLLIEVGGLRTAMEAAFGHLKLRWLPTQDGSNCVCLINPPLSC